MTRLLNTSGLLMNTFHTYQHIFCYPVVPVPVDTGTQHHVVSVCTHDCSLHYPLYMSQCLQKNNITFCLHYNIIITNTLQESECRSNIIIFMKPNLVSNHYQHSNIKFFFLNAAAVQDAYGLNLQQL